VDFIAVTKCIKKRGNQCTFHFKGFLKGKKITKIIAHDYLEKVDLDHEYIIHFKKLDESDGVLHSEIVKIKNIEETKCFF